MTMAVAVTVAVAMCAVQAIVQNVPEVVRVQNAEATVMCLENFHRNLNPVLRVTLKEGLQKASKENVLFVMVQGENRTVSAGNLGSCPLFLYLGYLQCAC